MMPPLFIIGIGGGTGAGKSFLADQLQKELSLSVYHLCTDRYLRDLAELPQNANGLAEMDTPAAYHLDELMEHIDALSAGEPTYLPIYDRQAHLRSPISEGVQPPQVLIVEGIIALVSEKLRTRFNLKIAVETDARIRMIRRMETDLSERRLKLEIIKKRLLGSVIPADETHILPANDFADIRVDGNGDIQVITNQLKTHLAAQFGAERP